MWRKLINSQSIPSVSLVLNVKLPTFFIKSKENNLGNALSPKPIAQSIRERLLKEGFKFVEAATSADYVIDVNANTTKAESDGDIFAAVLTATISVTDLDNNKLVFSKDWSNFRGTQTDFDKAGMVAFQKMAREVQLITVPAILEEILNL
jgi:hypothetical protein